MDFDLIQQSGMRQNAFAQLCGVSRTTVNLWVVGKMNPHRLLRDRVEAVLNAIKTGIEDKRLPTKSKTNPPEAVVSEIMGTSPTNDIVS